MNRPPWVECRILRLLDDGTPVVELGDASRALSLHGVVVPVPPPEGYVRIMTDRLGAPGRRLRCEPAAVASPGSAQFFYLAWQDKSGDVWLDLAQTLLEEGLVRVAADPFPERKQYQQYERRARDQRLGIWK